MLIVDDDPGLTQAKLTKVVRTTVFKSMTPPQTARKTVALANRKFDLILFRYYDERSGRRLDAIRNRAQTATTFPSWFSAGALRISRHPVQAWTSGADDYITKPSIRVWGARGPDPLEQEKAAYNAHNFITAFRYSP